MRNLVGLAVMFLHVKFPEPRNVEAQIAASEIAYSVSAKNAFGKRKKTKFEPKSITDFKNNVWYLCKSSEKSLDGKKHPYYCQIGAMGGK